MFEPDDTAHSQTRQFTGERSYVRFAALGDSATHGLGDLVGETWRGWARILADAIGEDHDVSFCNLAIPGATVADVRRNQLPDALAHRPQVASLIVGLNDTLRSSWDPEQLREDLLHIAGELTAEGAILLTARFHDHSRVFGLPQLLGRPMARRIEQLNEIYDEIHATYGGLQIDLAAHAEVYIRSFWSVDRLHPSELGHRVIAREFATLLDELGLSFSPPSSFCTSQAPSLLQDAQWLVTQAAPWLGRRARDFGPWVARRAVSEVRARVISRLPIDDSADVQRLAA
jgi:lysophospholipase L1-like esterase